MFYLFLIILSLPSHIASYATFKTVFKSVAAQVDEGKREDQV